MDLLWIRVEVKVNDQCILEELLLMIATTGVIWEFLWLLMEKEKELAYPVHRY